MNVEKSVARYRTLSEISIGDYPALNLVIKNQLDVWPEHESAIATSLGNLPKEVLEDIELSAIMVNKLANEHFESLKVVCEGYRYFCEKMILEAELFFRRNKKYERSTFEEAFRDVYSNSDVMEKYMNGLLISGLFWSNHSQAITFYRKEFLSMLPDNFTHLEVGPGHGALLHITANSRRYRRIVGWDVSPSSIDATFRSLTVIGIEDDVELICQDMMLAESVEENFDSVVVSELLEHLEDPLLALNKLRNVLKPGGLILVNMPSNSPAPDHLYLIDNPQEMIQLIEQAGYVVEKNSLFPMTGYSLERCLKDKLTITCVAIARNPL